MQGHALVKIQAMEEPLRDNISVTCVVQSRNAKPTQTHCDSQRIHYKRRLLLLLYCFNLIFSASLRTFLWLPMLNLMEEA